MPESARHKLSLVLVTKALLFRKPWSGQVDGRGRTVSGRLIRGRFIARRRFKLAYDLGSYPSPMLLKDDAGVGRANQSLLGSSHRGKTYAIGTCDTCAAADAPRGRAAHGLFSRHDSLLMQDRYTGRLIPPVTGAN